MTNDEDDFTEADLAALQLAVDLSMADDSPDPGHTEQVRSFLAKRPWLEVSKFCAYHWQMRHLGCRPYHSPPCWIVTEEEADAILKEGPRAAHDGSGRDISNCASAWILKRMLRAGISPFHPDPLRALGEKP